MHIGMLHFKKQCPASLGRGHYIVELDHLELENRARVNVYVTLHNVIEFPREIFVMSKCPDAEDAEATILDVMQNVGHKASLNFTYIASYMPYNLNYLLTVE